MSAAAEVAALAASMGLTVEPTLAYRYAKAFNSLEGIEGDETLDLIAVLLREGCLASQDAVDMILRHHRETMESKGGVREP